MFKRISLIIVLLLGILAVLFLLPAAASGGITLNDNSSDYLILPDREMDPSNLPPPPPFAGEVNRENFELVPENFSFDKDGILMAYHEGKWHYNPLSIANYTLSLYGAYYNGDKSALEPLLAHANWLYDNSVPKNSNGRSFYVNEYTVAYPLFKLEPGFYSGLASAATLCVFQCVGFLTGDEKWTERAEAFLPPFDIPLAEGGLRYELTDSGIKDAVWYEEYVNPEMPAHVLNGHIYTVFFLEWFGIHAENELALKLADDGLKGLEYALPQYDELGFSVYDLHNRIVNCKYHQGAHVIQLNRLYEKTGTDIFLEYAERWGANDCVGLLKNEDGKLVNISWFPRKWAILGTAGLGALLFLIIAIFIFKKYSGSGRFLRKNSSK